MARYDQPGVTYDSNIFYDQPDPAPNPPRKRRKTMKHQDYFPLRIGNQVIWLRNFKLKLPTYVVPLGLVPGDVTDVLLDVDNAIYGLDDFRGALETATAACYTCIDKALYDETMPGNIGWMGFTPPAGAPVAVAHGCLKRVFTYIADKIKDSTGYNEVIGHDLGTEGPEVAPPSPTVTPEFTLRTTSGGKLEVVWTKNEFDGVKLAFDLGAAGTQTDIDLRPHYTLNWLPTPGQSAVIKVRLRYLYKGEEFGNWSEWQTWTLTGA